jgi:F-type H+-transporting ATPase subunit epsilon
MKCLIVTPERTVLDVEATSIVLPLIDGEYGVLPGHTPLIARIGAGELRIKPLQGETIDYYVEGGFTEILDDVVAVLSMHALPVSELDVARAERQFTDALNRSGGTPELAQLREDRLNSRRARLRVAKKAR